MTVRSIAFLVLSGCASCALASLTPNPFDRAVGGTTYANFSEGNWQSSFEGLTPHAGTDFFATANGNFDGSFSGSINKELGGTIENQTYAVSFFVSKYYTDLAGLSFNWFSQLRIGGAGGAMTWTSTPTPVATNVWVEWRGLYQPSTTDLGEPFRFVATVQVPARTSLAMDGFVMASVVPEPTMGIMPLAALGLRRRRRPSTHSARTSGRLEARIWVAQ